MSSFGSFCAICVSDDTSQLIVSELDGKAIIACRGCVDGHPRDSTRKPVERGYNPSPSIGGVSKRVRNRPSPTRAPRSQGPVGRQRGLGCDIHRIPVVDADGKARDALEALQSVGEASWVGEARYLGCHEGPDGMLMHVFDSRPVVVGRKVGPGKYTTKVDFANQGGFGDGVSGDVIDREAVVASGEENRAVIASIVGRIE